MQKIYAALTFALLAVAAVIIVGAKLTEPNSSAASTGRDTQIDGEPLRATRTGGADISGELSGSSDPTTVPTDLDPAAATGRWGDGGLVVGMASTVPRLDELPQIDGIPWSVSKAVRAFRQLESRQCSLLAPGSAVQPPLMRPDGKRPSVVGRLPAFTIGLAVDPLAKDSLPKMSASRIVEYMEGHRLAIAPPIYHSPETGYYLGNDVRAAFYSIDDTEKTTAPESLIAVAVRNLRVIGLVKPEDDGLPISTPTADDGSELGRTLLLEFQFKKDSPSGPKSEIELVIIHLLDTPPGQTPRLAVFATDESREEIHELILPGTADVVSAPSLTGTVRFDDFTVMGLYPDKPVVTGVRLNSRQSISADMFRKTQEGANGDTKLSVADMLDNLHQLGPGGGGGGVK